MAVELKVPAVGESITEVQIGQWLKGEGQAAEKDESLVEIETDKATIEISAPVSGTVSKVLNLPSRPIVDSLASRPDLRQSQPLAFADPENDLVFRRISRRGHPRSR